jgi:hypothetical protein
LVLEPRPTRRLVRRQTAAAWGYNLFRSPQALRSYWFHVGLDWLASLFATVAAFGAMQPVKVWAVIVQPCDIHRELMGGLKVRTFFAGCGEERPFFERCEHAWSKNELGLLASSVGV